MRAARFSRSSWSGPFTGTITDTGGNSCGVSASRRSTYAARLRSPSNENIASNKAGPTKNQYQITNEVA